MHEREQKESVAGIGRRLRWLAGPSVDGSDDYPVLTGLTAGNVVFLALLFFKSTFPSELYIALFAVLSFAPPIAFGYARRPFPVGVGIGSWPAFSLGLQLGNNGIPTEYIINMIQSGIFYGGLALPVATTLYGIGVFARERRLGGEHTQRFARQALLTFALAVAIVIVRLTTDLLSTDVVD